MALTAAEKMKRRRDKLKIEGKYEDYKKNQSESMKKSRAKKKSENSKLSPRFFHKITKRQRGQRVLEN